MDAQKQAALERRILLEEKKRRREEEAKKKVAKKEQAPTKDLPTVTEFKPTKSQQSSEESSSSSGTPEIKSAIELLQERVASEEEREKQVADIIEDGKQIDWAHKAKEAEYRQRYGKNNSLAGLKYKSLSKSALTEHTKDGDVLEVLDVDTAKTAPNVKYHVNIVDTNNIHQVLDNEDLEIISIHKGTGFRDNLALTGAHSIGDNMLDNAQKNCNYVLHNKKTGELFQYRENLSANDTARNLQSAKDNLNEYYYTGQQVMAGVYKKMEVCEDKLDKACKKYGIELDKPITNDQYALIQPILDEYAGYTRHLERVNEYYSSRCEKYQNAVDMWEKKQSSAQSGYTTMSDYQSAYSTIKYAKELEQAIKKPETRIAWEKEHNIVLTSQYLQDVRDSAKSAQQQIDSFSGYIVDIDGYHNSTLNEIAQSYLDNENQYTHSNDTISRYMTKYLENGNLEGLQIDNAKQVNSIADIVRHTIVSVEYDKNDALTTLKLLGEDLKGYGQLWADETTRSSDQDNLMTGWSGMVLNEMSDMGGVFTGWIYPLFQANGFQSYTGQAMTRTWYDGTTSTSAGRFVNGGLLNEQYYIDKARTGSGTYWDNFKLAREAMMRGDLDGASQNFTSNVQYNFTNTDANGNVITRTNDYDTTFEKWTLGITDFALGIVTDPTSWVSWEKSAADKMINGKAAEVASKYTDDVIDGVRRSFCIDDIEHALKSTTDENLIRQYTKRLDDFADLEKALRPKIEKTITNIASKALQNSDEISDALISARVTKLIGNTDEFVKMLPADMISKRGAMLDILSSSYDKAIRTVSSSKEVEVLWKEGQKLATTAAGIKALDRSLNTLQFGAVGLVGVPVLKLTKRGLSALKATKVIGDLSHKTAVFCNQLAWAANRTFHKGTAGLENFNVLSRAYEAGVGSDIIKDIRKSLAAGEALDTTALEELSKLSSVTRSDFGRAVFTKEFDTMYEALLRSDVYALGESMKTFDDCAAYLDKFKILTMDDIDDLFRSVTGKGYTEYIEYGYQMSRKLDDIDSGYRIMSAVDAGRKKIEFLINQSNDRVRAAQVYALKKASTVPYERAMEVLSKLDLATVEPRVQSALQGVMANLDKTKAMKELARIADSYEGMVADITARNGGRYIPVAGKVVMPDVKYATPRDYIATALNQAGTDFTEADIDRIAAETLDKFKDDPEALGKYYIFKNSAETNFNGILNNSDLDNILFDNAFELADDTDIMDLRNTFKQSSELRNTLSYMYGTDFTYHYLMDTITGSADELNMLWRRAATCSTESNINKCLKDMAEYVTEHASHVQEVAGNLEHGITASTTDELFRVFKSMYSMAEEGTDLIVTRDNVYCMLLSINERVLKSDMDNVQRISSKLERAINTGAYTTNNVELGRILSGNKLNELINAATGTDGFKVKHMQAIWDTLNSGEDIGLRTLLDADNAKDWVKSDIVDKLVQSGHVELMDELNDYANDLKQLSLRISDSTELTVEDLNNIRNMYLQACSELTEPRNLRYMEYFSSIDFTDTKKALTAVKDFEERMGINVNVVMAANKVDFPEVTVRYATECANEWHYIGHSSKGNIVNLGSDKIDNLLYYKQYVDDLDEQRKAGQSALDNLLARREASSMITDEAGQRAMLDYNVTRAEKLNEIYDKFNITGLDGKKKRQLRRTQIEALHNIEDDFARANVSRITRMGKDELDNLLVRSGNFMLCDTTKYNELSDMLARLDMSGEYIVTRVKVGDEYVQCLSLDVSKIDATRKEFLRTAQFVEDADVDWKAISSRITDSVKVLGEDTNLYENLFNAYEHNKNTLGRAWTYSQNGSLQDLDFMATIQNQLPTNCQLDGTWKDLWSSSYTCNILLDNQVAHEIGAIKGSMLGSWYYAGVSEVTRAIEIGDIYNMMASKTNSLGTQLKRLGVDINDTHTVQDILARGNYHVVTMDTTLTTANITKSGRHTMNKYGLRVLDDATNFSKYADATLVDGETFRYLSGEVIANNRAMRYLTDPAGLVKVADAFDNIRSAYVTGMLYASNFLGTGFRNIMDSNWKALNELGADKAYAGHWLTMVDQQNTYVHMMQQVYEETGKQGIEGITEWLAKHADDANAENLTKWHTCFSLTETANDDLAKVYRAIDNKRILDSLPEISDKEAELVNKAFKNVRDKHFINKRFMNDSQMYDEVVKELNKAFGEGADSELITKIANKYGEWNMGNVSHWYTEMFDADNRVGAALSKLNKTTFDNAEVRCRNAMLMTLMERGEDAVSANRRVIKTQFDYGTKLSKGVNAWDKLMPFAKYQFSNAAYWLDTFNYSSFAGANARRISQITNGTKSTADALKIQFAYNYLANKYGASEDDEVLPELNPIELFKQSLNDTIENYKGTPNQYVQGAQLSDHRFLKVGNGFMDTMDWLQTVCAAIPQLKNGEVPQLIEDTMFSPIKTLANEREDIVKFFNGDWDALKMYNIKTDKSWYYDILNMVPVFGNLANMCITDYKNILANDKLFALTMQNTECTNWFMQSIGRAAYDFGFGVLNSVIGLSYDPYDNRKIFKPYTDADGNKVYWRDLTDEQKKSYIYHPVMSQDLTYYTNPTNVYTLYGRLAKMGLNQKAISLLTDKTRWANDCFRYDSDGKRYLNTAYVETIVLDMLEQGYTIPEISYLLICKDELYDLNTHSIIRGNQAKQELEAQMMSKAFLYDYQMIPEYIRYQPDMYAEMMARYKAMGYTTAEAWRKMRYDFEYIDEGGNLTKLTEKQAAEYSKWLRDEYYDGQKDNGFFKYYETLPDYIKYEKGAYSRTLAYLKQMFSTEEAQLMIKNGAYYTVDGRLINCSGLTRTRTSGAFQDNNGYWHKAGDFQVDGYWFHKGDNPYLGLGSFSAYWATLPEYTKYTKGVYSNTNQVMKKMGLDYNTRSKLIQDGAVAMQCDPNDPKIQSLLANAKQTTTTQYVAKQVPLRECSLVNGAWVWNGAQVIQCTNTGDGIATETIQVNLEHYAAQMGVTKEQAWKSYGAAMVTVNVPTTVVTAAKPDGSIGTVWTDPETGKTWVIVEAPKYSKPRREYSKVGYPAKQWKDWNDYTKPKKKTYQPTERVKRIRGYWGMNQNPMTVNYSNVSTYSKNYFLGEQGAGYEKWAMWGDGNITNHRNRNGRFTAAPSTYRNPRAYQSTMYKKLYGKYGASRMNQRQNIAGYSNASVTKLHRNEIANRTANLRYSGRR